MFTWTSFERKPRQWNEEIVRIYAFSLRLGIDLFKRKRKTTKKQTFLPGTMCWQDWQDHVTADELWDGLRRLHAHDYRLMFTLFLEIHGDYGAKWLTKNTHQPQISLTTERLLRECCPLMVLKWWTWQENGALCGHWCVEWSQWWRII